ncbi:MAG TPA: bestrophin family ion channel, partial [Cyclobacteriaceae bacterium]
MYTKKKYSGRTMLRWTRRELRFFVISAVIVTVLYEVMGLQWLQVPWTALALIGTAVAFLIGFQSNAVYGRLWEARQIWGGIVNDSRMFAIMVLDMVTNEYAK